MKSIPVIDRDDALNSEGIGHAEKARDHGMNEMTDGASLPPGNSRAPVHRDREGAQDVGPATAQGYDAMRSGAHGAKSDRSRQYI